jgi:hypothetical protein
MAKFGLKAAQKASEFTQTETTRRAVLGVLGVFGIKNTVQKEATALITKSIKQLAKTQDKIVGLEIRQNKHERECISLESDIDEVNETVVDWCLGNEK